MKLPCDCCEGPDVLTPLPTDNRPGLSKLRYRVGTHATFFETMRARLSSVDFPELAALKTRERNDPTMALLDAWATVGDVLTFYQERIANEGYLRTATERRSILEQARLVGYRLRPGVAASVYLAYTVENDRLPVEIPQGARVNSIPAPGEQMQAFETSEPLMARHEWNALKPRMAQPQTLQSIAEKGLYLRGTATNLKPNDALLIDLGIDAALSNFGIDNAAARNRQNLLPLRVADVKPDSKADRTLVTLLNWDGGRWELPDYLLLLPAPTDAPQHAELKTNVNVDKDFVDELKIPPSVPIESSKQLTKSVRSTFSVQAEIFPKLISALSPRLGPTLYLALSNAKVAKKSEIKVYALRKSASLFGHNAPKEPLYYESGDKAGNLKPQSEWQEWPLDGEGQDKFYLDAVYDGVVADSYVVVQNALSTPLSADVGIIATAVTTSRTAYGLAGKISRLKLKKGEGWVQELKDFPHLRATIIYCQSEELGLAEEPVHQDICGREIELEGIYDGLELGRWIIIAGERTDVRGTTGVKAAELVMLSEVAQKTRTVPMVKPGSADAEGVVSPWDSAMEPLPGDRLHTFIKFDKNLAYCYKRDTVTIYANVVKATHGETRREVLGSGDASKAFQSFELKQFPLTYVSAPTASGIESTLEARVNDIKWHEAANLAALGERDRKFITFQDDDETTSITFGNGERGARLPTGRENIRAVYRSGIGKPGNVRAGQISLLGTRPLGVKAVINPIRASGGADKEGRDQARKNVPLALLALDRLVSTSDYADFTRTFAGIGKATAVRSTSGYQPFVQVTIAGAEDIPIEEGSDLYRNLSAALHRYGDPQVPIRIRIRERLALVISANVRIHPDYLWEVLEPKIRSAMFDAFSFEKLELGEDLLLAEAVRVIQCIHGVVYVDMDVFDTLSETNLVKGFSPPAATEQNVGEKMEDGTAAAVTLKLLHRIPIEANQLAYLAPEVPDTLILQEIKT